MINIGTAVAYLEMDTGKFSGGLNSAWKDLKKFTDETEDVQTRFKGLSGAMSTIGSGLTKSVTIPLLGVGAAAVTVGMNFDKQMSKVKAISGASAEEFEQLRKKAIQMGNDTAFSQTEAAQAFEYMAMAGWKAEDMMNGIEGIMNLAAASGEDLALTSDIVTDALTAFGLSAKDSGHFADVLAAASSNSNTNVAMMGETFKYVAPVAGSLGYSIEDTALAIGLMANSGIKASMAGTSLRSTLTNLINPGEDVQAVLDQMGVSLVDNNGNMKEFSDVMKDLRKGFGEMKIPIEEYNEQARMLEEQLESGEITQAAFEIGMENLTKRAYGAEGALKATAAQTIAGKMGMSGFLAIVNASEEDFNKLTGAIEGSTDEVSGYSAAAEMASVMLDNFAGSVTLLLSALGTAAGIISDRITPYIQELTEKIKELVNWFNELSPEEQDQIVKWGLIAAAIGPTLLVLSKVVGVIGMLAGAASNIPATLTALQGAFAVLTSPALLAVAAITALVGAFSYLWKTSEDFRNKITDTFNQLKETLGGAFDEILERVNSLGYDFESLSEALGATLGVISDVVLGVVAPAFTNGFQAIIDIIGGVIDVAFGLYDFFTGLFSGDIEGALDGLNRAFGGLFETISKVFDDIVTFLVEAASNILKALGLDELAETIEKKFGEIKEFVLGVPDAIMQFGENVVNFFAVTIPETIASFIEGVSQKIEEFKLFFTEGIPSAFEDFKLKVSEKLNEFMLFFTETIPNAFNEFISVTVPEFINNVVTFFQELPYNIGYAIGEALGHVFLFGQEIGTTVVTAVGEGINAIIQFFVDLPGKVFEFIAETLNNVTRWSLDMQKKAGEMGRKFLDSVVNFFKQLPGRVKSFVSDTFNRVSEWARNMVNKAREMASNFLNNVVSFFQQLPGKVYNYVSQALQKITTWVSDMKKKATEAAKGFLDEVVKWFKDLPGKIKEKVDDAIQAIKDKVTGFKNAGKDIFNALWDGIKSVAGGIKDWVSGWVDEVKGFLSGLMRGFDDTISKANKAKDAASSVDGSHAGGLSYVPFDGYIAELHKGERVLTRQENQAYSSGAKTGIGGGDTFVFYNTKPDPYEYARQLKRAKMQILTQRG